MEKNTERERFGLKRQSPRHGGLVPPLDLNKGQKDVT